MSGATRDYAADAAVMYENTRGVGTIARGCVVTFLVNGFPHKRRVYWDMHRCVQAIDAWLDERTPL